MLTAYPINFGIKPCTICGVSLVRTSVNYDQFYQQEAWLKLADHMPDLEREQETLGTLTEEEQAALAVLTRKFDGEI